MANGTNCTRTTCQGYGRQARYRCATGDFVATIVGISSIGELRLQLPDGAVRSFGFKEIAFVV